LNEFDQNERKITSKTLLWKETQTISSSLSSVTVFSAAKLQWQQLSSVMSSGVGLEINKNDTTQKQLNNRSTAFIPNAGTAH